MPNTTGSSSAQSFAWSRVCLVAALVTAAALFAGCGNPSSPRGGLGENQQILASCDPSTPPASFVQLDGSGSSLADAITTERMAAVETVIRRTAICGGHLRVIVFSSSSSATTSLFDGPLHLDGATDNARLKRVPRMVDETMTQIRQAYGPAISSLPQGGSDITAEYRLAGEWMQQLGGSFRLHLYLLTDGFQNIGIDLGARPLSKEEATALADQVTVPMLPGAAITVAGLGRVAGPPPPSQAVEGLVAYYDALCHKTTASECISVTDYAAAGR